MPAHRVLAINPGSTSTKVALFEGERCLWEENLEHGPAELTALGAIPEQYPYRKAKVEELLARRGVAPDSLSAVVGRGGLLKPLSGGTYAVNDLMIEDLRQARRGQHASNLGAVIAYGMAREAGIPAYIVDPVSVDEFELLARISGLPEIERASLLHALNMKAVARRAARDLGKAYDEINLVVAHLGSGISIAPVRRGRMIDVNNANEGGPFSPERAGSLPTVSLVRLCFSGQYSEREMIDVLTRRGGLVAHLGTGDARLVEQRIAAGDARARLVFEAMAYQIAKEIGAMATVLRGELSGIVLTGRLALSDMLADWVRQRVSFIAPVLLYPGEDELRALAEGAMRVLDGEEEAKTYS